MSKKGLKKELEWLKSSCQDSSYWNNPPRGRTYMVEYEEKERHYDNLVLQSLKEYDDICGYKVGEKVCFQKHCNHEETNEGKVKEERKIVKKKEEKQEHPFDLLIEALKMMISEENDKNIEKEKEEIEMDKLVPYSDTDVDETEEDESDEIMSDTDDSIVLSEEEIEELKGQVPMYLLPAGYQFKNWE